MSSFKRFVEIAKSEVGALRDRVTGRSLEDFTDDELSREIEKRRLERELRERREAERAAQEAKRAKDAAATTDSRASRGDSSAGAPKADPPRPDAPPDVPPDAPPPPRAARGRGAAAGSGVGKTLAQYYANLEVPVGADLETVKRAYRKLMRRYHPDRHADDPAKFKTATELAQSLTRAYMEVKKHLEGTRS